MWVVPSKPPLGRNLLKNCHRGPENKDDYCVSDTQGTYHLYINSENSSQLKEPYSRCSGGQCRAEVNEMVPEIKLSLQYTESVVT